jgi:NADPH-dependent ferric siderophore reductase
MFPFSRTQGLMSQLLAPLKPGTRRLRVRAVHTLSPRMRRVVFTGDAHDALADLADAAPGAAIKLMFPAAAASGSASGTARTLGRAYTIRRYHAARGVLEIDFVVHDDTPHAQHGPAARWLERAAPGDVIEFAGPKRGFHADPAAPWTLLVGDETALPAIFAILEALPESAPAQAFIAIGHGHARLPLADTAQARNADIHWIEAEIDHAGARTVAALSAHALPTGTPQVFLAGEASLLKQARALLEGARGIPREAIDAKGYWTAGLTREERKSLPNRLAEMAG